MANIMKDNIVLNKENLERVDQINGRKSLKSSAINLRDCCEFLNQSSILKDGASNSSPSDTIINLMCRLNIEDDGIVMNQKIKSVVDILRCIQNESMLYDLIEDITNRAIEDHDASMKLGILITSLEIENISSKTLLHKFWPILEKKFNDFDLFHDKDKNRMYNFITLLGELIHRKRYKFLYRVILKLMTRELENEQTISFRFAKLILSQITLNGAVFRSQHKESVSRLLFHLRRIIIVQNNLAENVKALIMMTLDLVNSNFRKLDKDLETMYTKYLMEDWTDSSEIVPISTNEPVNLGDSSLINIGYNWESQIGSVQDEVSQPIFCNSELNVKDKDITELDVCKSNAEVSESCSPDNNYTQKKWSEQLLEDEDVEHETFGSNDKSDSSPICNYKDNVKKESFVPYGNTPVDYKSENKIIPRWRTTRIHNRDSNEKTIYRSHVSPTDNLEFTANVNELKSNKTSNIRLYSVNDRLKHVQEKFDRKSNNFNSVNANWDQQSMKDDQSERSYFSNYERGSHRKRSNLHYNNRHTYDKPPRFQKKQLERNISPAIIDENSTNNETWRKTNSINLELNTFQSGTLPRQRKSKHDRQYSNKFESCFNKKKQDSDEYLGYNRQTHKNHHSPASNDMDRDHNEKNIHKNRGRNPKNKSSNWSSCEENVEKSDAEQSRRLINTNKHMTKHADYTKGK